MPRMSVGGTKEGVVVGDCWLGGIQWGHQWRRGQSLSPFIIIYLVLRFKNTHYHASLPSHSHIFIMIFFQPRHIFLIPGDKMTRVWG